MPTSKTATSAISSLSLNSSELANVYTTPIQLLPAPGSGFHYLVETVEWVYNFATTAYTSCVGNFAIQSGSGSSGFNSPWAKLSSNFFSASDSQYSFGASTGAWTPDYADFSVFDNAAIYLTNRDGYDMASGDGTLSITLKYQIVQD